jgi:uncharacterized protein (DUF169 family)
MDTVQRHFCHLAKRSPYRYREENDHKGGKMENINLKLSNKFRSQWIKVKFYQEAVDFGDAKTVKGLRFCEATKEAIHHPVLLDRSGINCPGARYAFGWGNKNMLMEHCEQKGHITKEVLESMLPSIPYFKEPFNYIGLNTKGEPDLVLSYILPECAMDLIKLHHSHFGTNLDVSLCSMMPICSGIAVRTYLEEKVAFSFACEDSRQYGSIDRNRMAVGIPKKLFPVFAN